MRPETVCLGVRVPSSSNRVEQYNLIEKVRESGAEGLRLCGHLRVRPHHPLKLSSRIHSHLLRNATARAERLLVTARNLRTVTRDVGVTARPRVESTGCFGHRRIHCFHQNRGGALTVSARLHKLASSDLGIDSELSAGVIHVGALERRSPGRGSEYLVLIGPSERRSLQWP